MSAHPDAGTTIVVPCFDEAARLQGDAFVAEARARGPLRFLFVDDGSRDGTLQALEGLAKRAPEAIGVLSLPRNLGKAEAVRRGLLEALREGPAYVGYWDADLATPLAELERFAAHLRDHPEVTLVMGSRVQLLGRSIQRHPARHYLGRIAATAVSLTLGAEVYDSQCGAKLLRAVPGLSGWLAEPFLTRWAFDVELLARLATSDPGRSPRDTLHARVHELPLLAWRDVAGSKIRVRDMLALPRDLLRIALRYGPELRAWRRTSTRSPARASTRGEKGASEARPEDRANA